ncbi:MAG TPA: DUF3617 domain-containing protein [Pseudomonadales bacterium]|jgi:hypothetical protein
MKPITLVSLGLALMFPSLAIADTMAAGLWEIQNRTTIDGTPVPGMNDILKDVPPEARQQMKGAMAAQGIELTDQGVRICISTQQASANDIPVIDSENGCQVTRTENAPGHWSFKMHCSNPPGSGEGTVELTDSKHWKSHYRIQRDGYADYNTMEIDGTGSWVSSDCGMIAPQKR